MKKLLTALLAMSALTVATAQHHFDASYPDVHDPVMAKGEDGRYYSCSTFGKNGRAKPQEQDTCSLGLVQNC